MKGRKHGATQAQVADLLAKGWPPREIAKQLNITTQAVYEHMESIRRAAEAEEASA